MTAVTPLTVLRIGVITVAIAVTASLAGLIGALVTVGGDSVSAAITGRGLLALAAVLLVTRSAAARLERGTPDAAAIVLAGAFCGYLADPFSWDGRTAITQLLADPGVVTAAADLVLWLAVAALGASWGARSVRSPVQMTATPYG